MLLRLFLGIAAIVSILACSGLSQEEQERLIQTAALTERASDEAYGRADVAFCEQNSAWDAVATGPQVIAQGRFEAAKLIEAQGNVIAAAGIRRDANADLSASPEWQAALEATEVYKRLSGEANAANVVATEALEAVREAGLSNEFQETKWSYRD